MKYIVLAFALVVASCSEMGSSVPSNLVPATKPDATVPHDYARWSGVWRGFWAHQTPAALVIDEIHPDGAVAGHYYWGENPQIQLSAGSEKFHSTVKGGQLVVWGTPTLYFVLQDDETMEGLAQRKRIVTGKGTFHREEH